MSVHLFAAKDARFPMSLSKVQLSRANGVFVGVAAGDGKPLLPLIICSLQLIRNFV